TSRRRRIIAGKFVIVRAGSRRRGGGPIQIIGRARRPVGSVGRGRRRHDVVAILVDRAFIAALGREAIAGRRGDLLRGLVAHEVHVGALAGVYRDLLAALHRLAILIPARFHGVRVVLVLVQRRGHELAEWPLLLRLLVLEP